MGVYVKDVTAPKNCTGCIAVHYYMSMAGDAGMLCEVTGLRMDDYYSGGRPDWCPLIEVPEPHGDLIDRDSLPTSRVEWEDIVNAPTIIPASEEAE